VVLAAIPVCQAVIGGRVRDHGQGVELCSDNSHGYRHPKEAMRTAGYGFSGSPHDVSVGGLFHQDRAFTRPQANLRNPWPCFAIGLERIIRPANGQFPYFDHMC
jgi:hypothetical protein